MNILIMKDEGEFRRAQGWRLFHADFAGHWVGDQFMIRKDRVYGIVGKLLTTEQLNAHFAYLMNIASFMEDA